MRTAFLTLALVTGVLSGCATAPRVQGAGPEAPPALRAWIGYPIGSSRVHPIFTNREAHVAMFEIIPGRGVTMVYPRHRGNQIASDAHYVDLTLQPGRAFYHTDPFGHAAYQPRYYYAIASVAPLNLRPFQASLGSARRLLGRMYSSYRPFDVIDRLTEIIVPMQSDEDWTTDLFVDWPMPPMSIFASTRLVRCANGRVFQVPVDYPYHGCPGDSELAVVASTADAPATPQPPNGGGTVERPRAPRGGGNREGVELSNPGIDKRRRAEAGTRVPADSRDHPGRARIHYSDRESGPSPVISSRGSRSAGSSSSGRPDATGRASSDNTKSAEPSSPASPPSRSGGESSGSAKEKNP